MLNFKFNKSFPIILINNPIGVTTRKNIIPIINGEINFPKNNPNLNHILFNGVNNLELNNPNIKKVKEMINDQILRYSSFSSGYKLINKKTIKKQSQNFY